MLAASAGWGLSGDFFSAPLFSIYLFFPLFSFSFFHFLGDGLNESFNAKQHTNQPFRGMDFKITKSSRILEYSGTFNIVLPGNETVNFVFWANA